MYCLRLFIVVLIAYYNVYCYYVVCSLKSMCTSSFVLIGCCVSELHGHIGLRLIIVVLQELLHCLPSCLHVLL